MTNRPFLAHFGSAAVDRGAGPRQREDAIMRERLLGLEVDARQRLRAQSLDRIAIDFAHRAIDVARLRALTLDGKCTTAAAPAVEPVAAESWGQMRGFGAPSLGGAGGGTLARQTARSCRRSDRRSASSIASDSRAMPCSICLGDSAA